MSFFENLKNQIDSQFIEIIEWLDDSNDTLVYRFPVYNQEIKMGAQLIVRENQAALFVNEGKAADLFTPGRYELSTQNVPILTTLRGWKYGFQSPFKAEVYFFNTRLFNDLKWGTMNPIMMRDGDFGMIRVRAYGTYALRIADPKTFFNTTVGTQGSTTTDDILGQLRSIIISQFSDALAESKIKALDLAQNYRELGALVNQELQPEFVKFGLDASRFVIDNVSLPEEVEAAIDQRTKLGIFGGSTQQYAQMQAADAIGTAAANPGGLAGAGAGLGAGMAIGNVMTQSWGPGAGAAAPPPPPPPPAAAPRWTISVDGKTYGPYTDDALRAMLQAGQVSPAVQAWHPGAAQWAPLHSYAEFAGSVPPMPPPPPPAR